MTTVFKMPVIVCCMMLFSFALHAQDADKGRKYFDEGTEAADKYKTGKAIRLFEKAADQGNADAYKKLANWYGSGIIKKGSAKDVMKYTLLAAESGDAEYMNVLGFYYSEGRFTEKNIPEAIKWYKRASESGNDRAAFSLGKIYLSAPGGWRYDLAAPLFKNLADKGNITAKAGYMASVGDRLGVLSLANYYITMGRTFDNEMQAEQIYRILSDMGDGEATYRIGKLQSSSRMQKVFYVKAVEQGYAVPQADFDRADKQYAEAMERASILNKQKYANQPNVNNNNTSSGTTTAKPYTPPAADPYDALHKSQQKAEQSVDTKYNNYKP